MATTPISKLYTVYSRLTAPPVTTDNIEERIRMRLISSLFLFQTLIIMGVLVAYVPIQSNLVAMTATMGSGLLSFICYIISRTRHYNISIYMFVILVIAGLLGIFVRNSTIPTAIPEYSLSYLSSIIFFASLLLSVRATVIVSLVSLLSIASIPLVVDQLQYPIHYLWLFTLVTSIMIVVTAMIRLDVFRRLRESENRARSLMEAYIDGVVIYSNGLGILAVNPAFTELLGYNNDDVIGTNIVSLANNPQSNNLIETNCELDHKSQPYEVELSHKNGDAIVVELINQPHVYNEQPAQVFIIRDMRQYKESLRQQHEQEIRYQSLLELTDDAVFITDFDGTYIAVNQQAADMLKIAVEELTGKSFRDFIPEAYHTASIRVIERLKAGESVQMYERTFIATNGHRFPVEVMVRLLRDVNGEPQYIHSVVRDISERKRAEDQRMELAIERERMTTLQNFLRDASHYFRTPLSSLKTSQYLLTQIKDNPVKEQHFLHIMKLEIARLERLIADMMLSTQLEQDTGDSLTFGRLDLAQALPEIVSTYNPSEQREQYADIRIEPEVPPKQLYIMASLSKFSTALHRILDNAVTYSPPDSLVIVRAYQDKQNVCIAITDQGIGITEDEMPNLFQRFRRADRAVEMAHVGNGLGLFIAKKIIEMHYGEIIVESVPEEGSTFTIRLPMAIRATRKPRTQPSRQST